MVLTEGINWLLSGSPDGRMDPYRPSSVLGNITESITGGYDSHGHGDMYSYQQDEYYVSERTHGFLKSLQPQMSSLCNAPIDVVFHHYHGGSFSRPNGYIYDASRAGRRSTRKGRCIAIITMPDDPHRMYGNGGVFSRQASSMPSPYLQEYAMECIGLNHVEGIIMTDYRSWMFVHVDDLEPYSGGGRVSRRISKLISLSDPRFGTMLRVTYSHSMWGHDTTRRQLMHLLRNAHQQRIERRHDYVRSTSRVRAIF